MKKLSKTEISKVIELIKLSPEVKEGFTEDTLKILNSLTAEDFEITTTYINSTTTEIELNCIHPEFIGYN